MWFSVDRGSVYRRMGDFNAAVDDLLSAMDKCGHQQDSPIYINASKQLLLTYNDFAMVCFRQRRFDCAVTLLNKALKQEKGEKGLYLNRGGQTIHSNTMLLIFFRCCFRLLLSFGEPAVCSV